MPRAARGSTVGNARPGAGEPPGGAGGGPLRWMIRLVAGIVIRIAAVVAAAGGTRRALDPAGREEAPVRAPSPS